MEPTESLTRAVRALTIAVWCLCAVVLAQLGLYFWSYFRAASFNATASASNRTTSENWNPEPVDNDFAALPPEQKIQRATVILITKYRHEGGKLSAVISEILKKSPNTRFYYSVGEEFAEMSRLASDSARYGDGEVVFLTGNPAMMRESFSYDGDRVGGLGQMSLSQLRELAKHQPVRTAT